MWITEGFRPFVDGISFGYNPPRLEEQFKITKALYGNHKASGKGTGFFVKEDQNLDYKTFLETLMDAYPTDDIWLKSMQNIYISLGISPPVIDDLEKFVLATLVKLKFGSN